MIPLSSEMVTQQGQRLMVKLVAVNAGGIVVMIGRFFKLLVNRNRHSQALVFTPRKT
jgi:hypothetical protein